MKRLMPLILLILSSAAQASLQTPLSDSTKPEWKYVGLSIDAIHAHKDELYYDTKHVQRFPDGIVQVYLKEVGVYENAGQKQQTNQELIRNREHWPDNFHLEKYARFAYSVFTIEFNCSKGLRRYACIADFNEKDERIGSQCIEGQEWEKIPQESMAKKVYDAVCQEK